MVVIEKTGKTIEVALEAALLELNASREQVKIEVLEEPKSGFFGMFGARLAKIKVSLLEEAKEPEVVKEALEVRSNEVTKVMAEAVKTAGAPTARGTVSSEEAVNVAKEFLQQIFVAMKIKVVMEKFVNKIDGGIILKLHGPDMGILIGKHGQTLDALQYLTNLVANKNSAERVRIMIDVEDYRERRVETLTRLAQRLADKVKRTGERVVLEPMNPHERKIIHMALQNDNKVTTLSEGEEPYRKIVIELKK